MEKGVFIVIDGTDGSGKATQTKLLVDRLKKEGQPVETIAFPQYGKKSAGPVEEYLEGNYGTAEELGPYRASVFFAVDRFDASKQITTWLDAGSIVIADRFVSANMGHQGAKISDPEKRKAFFSWEMEFEHGLMQLPKPDVNLILHVTAEKNLELIQERASKGDLRKDIHEDDLNHLKAAEQTYLEIAEQFEDFTLVECMEDEKLLSPETIHERIWNYVQPYLDR